MITKKEWKYTLSISESTDGCASLFCNEQWFLTNHQVHGSRIIKITDPKKCISWEKKADGIISNLPRQKIGVRVADCNAIIFMWKEWFSVIHAWWRWLYKKIVQKAITALVKEWEEMNTMKVYIWPSIRVCCYEVGEEVKKHFKKKYCIKKEGKIYLDMLAYILDVLIERWINKNNIDIDNHCTKCSKGFFSYRAGNNQQRIIVGVERK